MKNKTLATWLAFLGGPLGLHRFYLRGLGDWLGWLLPIPTAIGLYGVQRLQQFGVDDELSWMLVPLLGLVIAACALTAIVYGLMPCEKWNARFNPRAAPEDPAGETYWLTVFAVAASLLVGAGVLMATIAFSFEHFWEYQIEAARKMSQ